MSRRRFGRLGADELAERIAGRQRRVRSTLHAIRRHGMARQYFVRLEGHAAVLDELAAELRRRLRTAPADLDGPRSRARRVPA